MLKRKATNFMKNWINTKDKKCLVVQGARQTGKTYTVERFAEENYEELVEINFKQMPSAMEIFSGDLTVDAMVMGTICAAASPPATRHSANPPRCWPVTSC